MNIGKIFNAKEVQAIIAGNKRMFREVIKPFPVLSDDKSYWEFEGVRWAGEKSSYAKNFGDNARPEIPDLCPYQVGQKIFCKESFADFRSNNSDIFYKSDFEINNLAKIAELKWKPAQHMKQEHSRLTLQIKEIRVEKLQNISEEDAIAEGIPLSVEFKDKYYTPENNYAVPKIAFMRWWNSTHKKPEEKFEANPWVWSIQFEVVKND